MQGRGSLDLLIPGLRRCGERAAAHGVPFIYEPLNPSYNPDLRQLLHVGFKIAAQLGDTYIKALKDDSKVVAKNVTGNLLERHMKPLFFDRFPPPSLSEA